MPILNQFLILFYNNAGVNKIYTPASLLILENPSKKR